MKIQQTSFECKKHEKAQHPMSLWTDQLSHSSYHQLLTCRLQYDQSAGRTVAGGRGRSLRTAAPLCAELAPSAGRGTGLFLSLPPGGITLSLRHSQPTSSPGHPRRDGPCALPNPELSRTPSLAPPPPLLRSCFCDPIWRQRQVGNGGCRLFLSPPTEWRAAVPAGIYPRHVAQQFFAMLLTPVSVIFTI